MKVVLAILFLVLAMLLPPRTAKADVINDVFQVLCMPELAVIEINELDANNETARRSIKEKREQLEKRYGIYVPQWHLVGGGIMAQTGESVEPKRITCALPGAAVEVTLLPERLPNGHYSISVTLTEGERILVDDVPFTLCDIGGPITSLLYNAAEKYVVFDGQFGGDDPDPPERSLSGLFTLPKMFFLGEKPLTPYHIRYLGSDHNHRSGGRLIECRPKLIPSVMPKSRHKWFGGFQ